MAPKEKGELICNERLRLCRRSIHESADYNQPLAFHSLPWTAVFPPKWVSTAIDGSLAAVYYCMITALVAGCVLGAVSCLPPKLGGARLLILLLLAPVKTKSITANYSSSLATEIRAFNVPVRRASENVAAVCNPKFDFPGRQYCRCRCCSRFSGSVSMVVAP